MSLFFRMVKTKRKKKSYILMDSIILSFYFILLWMWRLGYVPNEVTHLVVKLSVFDGPYWLLCHKKILSPKPNKCSSVATQNCWSIVDQKKKELLVHLHIILLYMLHIFVDQKKKYASSFRPKGERKKKCCICQLSLQFLFHSHVLYYDENMMRQKHTTVLHNVRVDV